MLLNVSLALVVVAIFVLFLILIKRDLLLHGAVELLGYVCAIYVVCFVLIWTAHEIKMAASPQPPEAVLILGTASYFLYKLGEQ